MMNTLEQARLNEAVTIEPIPPHSIDVSNNRYNSGGADSGKSELSDGVRDPISYKCVICGICLTIDQQPKLLECLHAGCAACLTSRMLEQDDPEVASNGFKCPRCGVFCNEQSIIDNYFVVEAETENDPEIKCVSCEDNAPATSYCVECKDFICASCVEAHRRVKITKDHTLKEKEEAEAEASSNARSRLMFCTIHPHEQCTLFCENCDRVTCRDCQLNEHRDHKYKFVHEIASETRCNISALLKEVKYKKALLYSAMKVIDDRQVSIADKKTSLNAEISQICFQIVEAVKAKLTSMAERLSDACDNKQQILAEKKKTLEKLSDLTDHCIDFVMDALNKGSDLALLCSKKTIVSHLQRIKARRADIPNPEIPVRITVCFDKLPELMKAVKQFGSIMVDNRVYDDGSGGSNFDNSPSPQLVNPVQNLAQNGNARHAVLKPMIPVTVRNRTSPVQHYQTTHSPHGISSRSPIYPISNMLMNVPGPVPYDYNVSQLGMPHVTIRPSNPPQQVTSSTHPSADIRNLMPNSNGNFQQILPAPMYNQMYRITTPKIKSPNQTAAPKYSSHVQIRNSLRIINQQPPPYPIHPQPQKSPSATPWHSPQQQGAVNAVRIAQKAAPIDESFKIHLKTQTSHNDPKSNVSSSVPQTPSPNTLKDDAQVCVDKFCEATDVIIAKLGSNGIEVIPECSPEPINAESTVDSSTESNNDANKVSEHKDDANEDWCAVCMDGGELICCDNCPKVFHVNCHIPVLEMIPEDNEIWQCLLCSDVTKLAVPEEEAGKRKHGLSFTERKKAERVLLELFCQYENSQVFREIPTDSSILAKMPKVVTLEMIRQKLQPGNSNYYSSLKNFVLDIHRMFKNVKAAYPRDSPVLQSAKQLEEVFDHVLSRWIPNASEYVDSDYNDDGCFEPKRIKKEQE